MILHSMVKVKATYVDGMPRVSGLHPLHLSSVWGTGQKSSLYSDSTNVNGVLRMELCHLIQNSTWY